MAAIAMDSIPQLAANSARSFFGLAAGRRLHRSREHMGVSFEIEDAGTFRVFRDTRSEVDWTETPVVLVVGFRL